MRRTFLLAVVVGLGLAGRSSGASKPAARLPASVASTATPPTVRTTSEPSAAAETCATPLPDRGDVIVREIRPGLATDAIELGGTDPEHCVLTFDYLRQTSPTDAGDCTQAAWAADNSNYNVDASTAPPLKKVQVTIGDCG